MIETNSNSNVHRERLREFTTSNVIVSMYNASHAIAYKIMTVARRIFRTFLMKSTTIPVPLQPLSLPLDSRPSSLFPLEGAIGLSNRRVVSGYVVKIKIKPEELIRTG